jgi:hypothetical protein
VAPSARRCVCCMPCDKIRTSDEMNRNVGESQSLTETLTVLITQRAWRAVERWRGAGQRGAATAPVGEGAAERVLSAPHGALRMVRVLASKRLVIESPWSQFSSTCQRFCHAPRLDQ